MRLEVRQCPYIRPLLDDEGALFATELAEALRSNAQLQELTLGGIDLWRNVAVGNAIVAALSGHPNLLALTLCCNSAAPHEAEVISALLALIANSPDLLVLNVLGVLNRRREDENDTGTFISDFHAAALAIKPTLSLPSMREEEEAGESDEEDEESETDSESESE